MVFTKRGQSILGTTLGMVFLFLICLIASIIFVNILANKFTNNAVVVPKNVEQYSIKAGFTNNCFSYTNSLGKKVTNSIDLSKFTEDRLNSCLNLNREFDTSKKEIAYTFELSLLVEGKSDPIVISSYRWNQKIQKQELVEHVTVYENNVDKDAELKIAYQKV